MAEKLLANASSKLTLEEKAKMEWIAKLEGKNSLSQQKQLKSQNLHSHLHLRN
ncbi:hypothetical protein ACG1DN_000492 [Acinetobacter baumannii]